MTDWRPICFPNERARSGARSPSMGCTRTQLHRPMPTCTLLTLVKATGSHTEGGGHEDERTRTGTGRGTRKEAHMRRVILSMLLTGAIVAGPSVPAFGAVSTTQHLPAAACNQGTMNAH